MKQSSGYDKDSRRYNPAEYRHIGYSLKSMSSKEKALDQEKPEFYQTDYGKKRAASVGKKPSKFTKKDYRKGNRSKIDKKTRIKKSEIFTDISEDQKTLKYKYNKDSGKSKAGSTVDEVLEPLVKKESPADPVKTEVKEFPSTKAVISKKPTKDEKGVDVPVRAKAEKKNEEKPDSFSSKLKSGLDLLLPDDQSSTQVRQVKKKIIDNVSGAKKKYDEIFDDDDEFRRRLKEKLDKMFISSNDEGIENLKELLFKIIASSKEKFGYFFIPILILIIVIPIIITFVIFKGVAIIIFGVILAIIYSKYFKSSDQGRL